MTEEVKAEKKRRGPRVISGDKHEVEAALHAEARVAEATIVNDVIPVEPQLPAHIRAEQAAGRAALAKNVKS